MAEPKPLDNGQETRSSRTLILLRHAKSAWDTGDPDHRRPLADRGRADALVAGRILAGYEIDVVLCSTATRTRQTWQRATEGGARCDDVRFLDDLYGADPDEVTRLLRGLSPDVSTAVVVGHEPTLSEFILDVAAPSAETRRISWKFPTCAVAVLHLDGDWAGLDSGTAEVTRFEVPRGGEDVTGSA